MNLLGRREMLLATGASIASLAIQPTGAIAASPRHVDWLDETQTPPKPLPANAPKLSSVLVDESGKPIKTRGQWEERRPQVAEWWQTFLGDNLDRPKQPLTWNVIEEDEVDNVRRQRISYEVEPGIATEAYLCQPKQGKRLPAIVVLHSTVEHSIYQPAGLKGPVEKAFGLQLAKLGYVTLSPRNFLWPTNEGIAAKEETEKFLKRAPGRKGMRKMLHDAQIAIDLLEGLTQVDSTRIGSVGHSLGAKEVLYLTAFDPRVKATVSSEGGIGIPFSNWDADWYLSAVVQKPDFGHEHHEPLAMCAPRPFLLIGGESADGDRGWPFIESALGVYRLYDDRPAIGQWNHRQGHSVPTEAVTRISEWFETYL